MRHLWSSYLAMIKGWTFQKHIIVFGKPFIMQKRNCYYYYVIQIYYIKAYSAHYEETKILFSVQYIFPNLEILYIYPHLSWKNVLLNFVKSCNLLLLHIVERNIYFQ